MKHANTFIKHFTSAFLACTLAVGGCASVSSLPALAAQEDTAAETDTSDSDALLKEDYYEYVNQELLETKEEGWSWMSELTEQTNETLHDILTDIVENHAQYAEGSNEQKIADFYLSIMDTETRDTYGLGELQTYVDAIYQAETIEEYVNAIGTLFYDIGYGSLLLPFLTYAGEDESIEIPEIYEIDLGLGKGFFQSEAYEDLFPEYESYMALALREAGYGDEAESYASDVFSFMEGMSEYSMEDYQGGDDLFVYNPYTMEELKELYSNIDIESFMSLIGMDYSVEYSVYNAEMCKAVNEAMTEDNLETLKAYSIFCLMNDFRDFLSTDLCQAQLELMDKIYGIDEAEPLEEIAEDEILYCLPYTLSEVYVQNEFDDATKDAVTDMTDSIIDVYRERISQLDWMDDDTKNTVLQKLDGINFQIGYPDEATLGYENADIISPQDGGTAISNKVSLAKAAQDYRRNHEYGEMEKGYWPSIYPTDVFAGYGDDLETIYVTAALLQAPFYDPDASDAQNYGAIGVILARYTANILDFNNGTYDANTNIDVENYEELTQKVAEYFDSFEINGQHVNGEQTLAVDIADLTAISVVASLFDDDTEQLDELFRSYANMLAVKNSDDTIAEQIETDTHAPERIRVNAPLMSLDSFYDVYPEIQEGDAMYIDPEDRVKVW